jgi:Asp-tRNA(Asn)/Glu-tRNA(Gln) amidotransferase A subunit family amidase
MNEPWKLTAAEAAAALAEGSMSSEDLVRACLARIAERDPVVKAWSYLDPDMALRSARELDKQKRRGPLHGVPVAIKDMIATADMPTQHNSPIYAGHRPGQDAACVAILRAAGAVILGKTDTHEFAAGGRLAATRNPHDLTRTAGGSSTGSGAAVGDFQVPLALGTQTAGSTIRPGSFNGAFAMKPTFGTLNREGAKVYAISLDTIGWFGRSVADLGLLADVFNVDRAPWAPRAGAKGLRIALCRTPYWSKAAKESQQAVERAARRLAKAGAKVADLDLPADFAALNDMQNIVMRGEGRAAFLAEYRRSPDLLHQDFRDRVEDKDGITPQRFAAAFDGIARLRPVFDKLAAEYDAILTPSAVGEAPANLAITGDPMFNRAWSALYVPCITIPAAKGPNGMPVGVQLVGPRYTDAKLLGVAAAVAVALGVARVA